MCERMALTSGPNSILGHSVTQSSPLMAVSKFLQAMDRMSDTVLIPRKLMDIIFEDANIPVDTRGCDLFTLFGLLNTMKNELLLGSSCQNSLSHSNEVLLTSTLTSKAKKEAALSPNAASASTRLVDSIPTRADSIDTDSGLDVDCSSTGSMEKNDDLQQIFRDQMRDLSSTLDTLTKMAHYITEAYRQELQIAFVSYPNLTRLVVPKVRQNFGTSISADAALSYLKVAGHYVVRDT